MLMPASPTLTQNKKPVDAEQFAAELRVVELSSSTRLTAIRRLIQATCLEADEGLDADELVEAIEHREEAARTLVASGFAMPHTMSDWDGEFRAVLGRSRAGIDFGAAKESGLVHLMLLIVFGKRDRSTQHTCLATMAQFFAEEKLRDEIIAANDVAAIAKLVRKRIGVKEPPRRPKRPKINRILLRQAISIVSETSAQAILIGTDKLQHVPWDQIDDWDGTLLVVTPDVQSEVPNGRPNTHLIDVPKVSLRRNDRAHLGLLLSAARGLVTSNADVVCLTGADGRKLDNLTVIRPQSHFESMFELGQSGKRKILPSVILRVVALALEIAEEGREGKPIGTTFVIGDSRKVRRHTQQLVLNPFHGHSKNLRSVLDPSLGETIKEFAQLDGAFVVKDDGMVLSAGSYIIPKSLGNKLPSGLGTRHQAAASITSHTDAIALVVSQSTGTVVVFRHGEVVLKLERTASRV